MNHQSINHEPGGKFGSGVLSHAEMALLGGQTPATSQTRVLAANRQSSSVRPADLDAFLQGYFKG